MDITLIDPTAIPKRTKASKKAGRVGRLEHEVTRIRGRGFAQPKLALLNDLLEAEPQFDASDYDDWTREDIRDRLCELDVSEIVERFADEFCTVPRDTPTDQITVADEADVRHATYTPSSLTNLPSEFVKTVIVSVKELSREELADVIRIVKPNGKIELGEAST